MNLLRILFAWSGRIDRSTFLATFGMMSVLGGVLFIPIGAITIAAPKLGGALTLLSLPLSGWCGLVINVKRLRDMGRTPALAFLPLALCLAGAALFLPGFLAALGMKSHVGVATALVGGGLLLILSGIVPIGMWLWMAFAKSSPTAVGERLTLFGAAERVERAGHEADRPSLGLDAALEKALSGRSAAPASPNLALSAAGPTRATGLPQRPVGRVVSPGGGFGRRR